MVLCQLLLLLVYESTTVSQNCVEETNTCDCLLFVFNCREATQHRLTEVEVSLRESEDEKVELANQLAQSESVCASFEDTRARLAALSHVVAFLALCKPRWRRPYIQSTDMNHGQAHCLPSQTPTLIF